MIEKPNRKRLAIVFTTLMILTVALMFACKDKSSEAISSAEAGSGDKEYIFKAEISRAPLPADLKWLTNDSDTVYASPEAKKGGALNSWVLSFPLTFRVVGPDSNSSFRSAILGNQLSLIGIHPNTENIVPELATHWAYGEDKKTMYFKLNEKARWSDGTPVSAHDFAYTLEFMRSKYIIAPWYNDYYSKEIDKVSAGPAFKNRNQPDTQAVLR
jgi:microcin C transport system substrate-binding protein